MSNMNIDERIEKLTERHEALAQTIELIILENRERYAEWKDQQAAWQAAWKEQQTIWDKRFGQIVGSFGVPYPYRQEPSASA